MFITMHVLYIPCTALHVEDYTKMDYTKLKCASQEEKILLVF